jgi:hypothetical protein
MKRLFLQILLIVVTCLPLTLLALDMAQRYSSGGSLLDIGLLDAAMLIAALGLPLCALPLIGVDWRSPPEEY